MRKLPARAWLLLLNVRLAAAAVPTSAEDVQLWQEIDVSGSVVPNLIYLVTGVNRFSDIYPNPELQGGGVVFTYGRGAFAFSLGYLYANVNAARTGIMLHAQLPLAAITGSLQLKSIRLSDTLRIEDVVGVPGNPWRYRNLVRIEDTFASVGPFKGMLLSDEVFVDVSSERFSRNRLFAGPIFGLTRTLDVTVAYFNERDVRKYISRIQGAFLDLAIKLH